MNPKRHFEKGLEMFAEYTNVASATAETSRNKLAMENLRKVSLGLAVTLIGLATVDLHAKFRVCGEVNDSCYQPRRTLVCE